MACDAGVCGCPAGMTSCSGTCANVSGSDAANCGRCGHLCLTGGACLAGACQPIPFVTTGTSNIADFATDGNVVVFADSGNGEIAQVSTPGRNAPGACGGWRRHNPGLRRARRGERHRVLDRVRQLRHRDADPAGLRSHRDGPSACGPMTRALANAGASTFDVLTSALYSVSVSAGCLLDTTSGLSGNLGASLSPRLAFGDLGNGIVVFGSDTDGAPSATIPNQPGVNWVSDDGTYAYWATSEPAIRRAAFSAPSSVMSVLANPGSAVGGLTTDGTNVYYQTSTGILLRPRHRGRRRDDAHEPPRNRFSICVRRRLLSLEQRRLQDRGS